MTSRVKLYAQSIKKLDRGTPGQSLTQRRSIRRYWGELGGTMGIKPVQRQELRGDFAGINWQLRKCLMQLHQPSGMVCVGVTAKHQIDGWRGVLAEQTGNVRQSTIQ